MLAGIGKLEVIPHGYYVVNVSSINLHNLCDQRWYYQRVDNRVPATIEADYIDTGRVGHALVQDLHQVGGTWNPDLAVALANKHAQQLKDEINRTANLMSPRDIEKRQWFVDWLPQAMPLYAAKHKSVDWEEELYVETPMWIRYDIDDLDARISVWLGNAGYQGIILVGTPDAVVLRDGKVWHLQRKFFSQQVDLESFLRKVPYQRHEILYLTIFEQLYRQGDLPAPAGHTIMDLVRKLAVPEDPDDLQPPKHCECGAVNMEEFDDETILLGHPSGRGRFATTEGRREHWQEEREKLARFLERVEKKRHDFAVYTDRAFVREPVRITTTQRQVILNALLYDTAIMAAKQHGLLLTTPREGWACNAYHRDCPYIGVCAGRESILGPQFVDRVSDYTDIPEEE